ncbi:AraC family transcriptional regulator [Chitinophaga lutea]
MKKKEGFAGQEAIVLPRKVIQGCQDHPLLRNLFITDIGYYPRAQDHYRERRQGSEQHILIYCTDGKGGCNIGGQEYAINTFDYLVVPAGTPHSYWASDRSPWSIYWMHFKGAAGDQLAGLLHERMKAQQYYHKYNEDHLGIFHNMYRHLQRGYSIDNLIFCSMSLHYFLASFLYPDKFSLPRQEPGSDPADDAIRYLQQHIAHPLSLQEVAAAVNLSASHFSSIFRKKTGFSPMEYFNHLKMQKACQLLQFSTLRIGEIGQAVGIEDPYYFSRLFHSMMGLSPREYRNRKEIRPS